MAPIIFIKRARCFFEREINTNFDGLAAATIISSSSEYFLRYSGTYLFVIHHCVNLVVNIPATIETRRSCLMHLVFAHVLCTATSDNLRQRRIGLLLIVLLLRRNNRESNLDDGLTTSLYRVLLNCYKDVVLSLSLFVDHLLGIQPAVALL